MTALNAPAGRLSAGYLPVLGTASLVRLLLMYSARPPTAAAPAAAAIMRACRSSKLWLGNLGSCIFGDPRPARIRYAPAKLQEHTGKVGRGCICWRGGIHSRHVQIFQMNVRAVAVQFTCSFAACTRLQHSPDTIICSAPCGICPVISTHFASTSTLHQSVVVLQRWQSGQVTYSHTYTVLLD